MGKNATDRAAPSRDVPEEIVTGIRDVFRQYGYDGATLSLISRATGLGRSSLYHYFPDGKDGMVAGALDSVERLIDDTFIADLKGPGTPGARLGRMLRKLDTYYDGGRENCLLGILSFSGGRARHGDRLPKILGKWISAMAALSREAGIGESQAERRAEEAMVKIQGGLLLSAGLGRPDPFRKTTRDIPQLLLDP